MGKEKQKNEFEKLKDMYSDWEEFMSRSKIKMRKKMKKDKQEYYDFDYTRGQYYYNYPENHINFAPPDLQKKFFKQFLQNEAQDFSQTILHKMLDDNPVEQDLKPLQLYQFLKKYHKRLQEMITSLRIRKTFYIRENLQEKKYIELMESEIRSLVYRHNKVENIFFKFSKPLKERIEGKVNSLKLKNFDEMHFAEVDKSDFVVYLRMENVRQRVCYPFDKLLHQVKLNLLQRRADIESRCYEERCRQIKALERKYGEKFIERRTAIELYFMENNPEFLENEDNLRKIEEYLNSLNFVTQYLKSRNENTRIYFNASKSLCELNYVPGTETEIKEKLFAICKVYFPEDMVQTLYEHKRQHLCYRLNYFAAIMLRAISESYNFLVQIKEKELHQCRNTMHRELQTIFTNEVDRLFSLPEHEIIVLVDEGDYHLQDFPPPLPQQTQTVFEQYFKMHSLVEPTSKSIIELLESKSEKVIRQVAETYAKQVVQRAPQKLRFLSLYYRNLHTDQKSHLISLLNEKLFFGGLRENILSSKIDQIFQLGQLNANLLQTVYILLLVHSIQLKTQLDNVLCAQISLMYELKYRIKLLQYKHSVPFEMSEEFLTRFTETNKSGQPFQFAGKSQQSNDEPYPDPQNCDKIVRRKVYGETKIEVRRMMPENPLFQGKKILYREAAQQSLLLLEKIHKTCAYLIERRENYLNEEAFTGLVDKFQLVHQILNSQLAFQTQKLDYLEELGETLKTSVQPQAIFQLANLMNEAKAIQVYHNLSDFHCLEQYKNKGAICSKKAEILKNLRKRLIASEERQAMVFRQKIMKQNHINNLPQISSIYYCDELPMQMEGDNIVEEDEGYSSVSQSQYMGTSSKYKSDLSVLSSDYHVKTTFKQILGRSSVNAQVEDQNRRQELMGKKKKSLINDSILGGIIAYRNNNSILYSCKILELMKEFEVIYNREYDKGDQGIYKEYVNQIQSLICSIDDEILQQQLFDQTLLHCSLADINRAISKVAQKIKIAPNALDHYLFMNSQILKNLVDSSNSNEVNEIRGLYTCLNIVHVSQMNYKYHLTHQSHQRLLHKMIPNLFKDYSTQTLPKQGLFLSTKALFQEHVSSSDQLKISEKLGRSGQSALQYCGNYSNYVRYNLLLNYSFLAYYESMFAYLVDSVNEYELLKRQLLAIEQYNCYFALDNDIIRVANIQNKVFVKRKYDFLCANQHKVLHSSTLKDFLEIPKNRLQVFPKMVLLQVQSEKTLIENAKIFQKLIVQIAELSGQMILMSRQVQASLRQKKELQKMEQLCKLLPYIGKYIKMGAKDNVLLKQTFFEHYQQLSSFEKQNAKIQQKTQAKVTVQYSRLSVTGLNRMFTPRVQKYLKESLSKMMVRKYPQFDQHELNCEKYYHHLQLESYHLPYRWHNDDSLKNMLDYRASLIKLVQLRLWIEGKIVCFGSTLTPQQLLQLRATLLSPEQNFPIFWRDQSSQLVKHADLVKMKYEDVDQLTVTDHYTARFITFENLKLKYKQFLDCLSELDLKNEGLQILNIFYISSSDFFKHCSFTVPQYLKNYCFLPVIKNQTSKFMDFAISTNPNRYLLSSNKPIKMALLKALAWNQFTNQPFKAAVAFLDEKCAYLKQLLNSSNSKMNEITNELSVHFFHHQRMKQMLDFLRVGQTKQAEGQYSLFLKKYNDDLLLGNEKLSPLEKYLSKFVEKIVKEKPEMMHLKDEIMDKLYRHKFNQARVEDRIYEIANKTLADEVKLFRILLENYTQKELLRENRIIKSTLNKVLVPKIIINPYLESPMILQNYFFAASLKLSYIDNFLNRLKNRAILVELTEGGFGYLLKVNQLDECVQSLCKGVITFTEKEFNDRFRTFVETYDQLHQKYRKAKLQNDSMKSIFSICRQERGKELTAQLYNKLDSYLLTFHTKEKTYNSVVNLLKSLEIEVSKKVSQSYLSTIRELEEENKVLKQKFVSFRQILNRSTKMSMEHSKDLLYNSFKKEVENILNKPVLKGYAEAGEKQYEKQESQALQTLMKRLRTQKLFYEMKVSNLEGKIKLKTQEVNKLSEQLSTLQNTLSSEQFKNTFMNEEIKSMHKKNIEIEELKREIAKKEEEEIINKFKLIKINENLQGKLSRLEEKKSEENKEDSRLKKRQENTLGVQTVFVDSRDKTRFRVRTDHSQPNHSHLNYSQPNYSHSQPSQLVGVGGAKNEIESIWKQKWQQSERKYQILMAKVVQVSEKYSINKNSQLVVQKVREIAHECLNNRIYKKP